MHLRHPIRRARRALKLLLITSLLLGISLPSFAAVNEVEKVADGVYFQQGDIRRGHCNNGWIVFKDYVLVVDANYPSGAEVVIPKIKETAGGKPIRFTFDTHHHGDHLYGNQVWVEQGATPVAHAGVLDELKKYETGLFGSKPGRWENEAKNRKDLAASKLTVPSVLFDKDLVFDDGNLRAELLHFGVAHTHGDGFVWLPKQRILFTGDAVVNGPYNFAGDGDIAQWIETLEKVKKLDPKVVCPGHGATGDASVIEDQQRYFMALRDEVKKFIDAGKKAEEVKASAEAIKAVLMKDERIVRYIGGSFVNHVEKMHLELTTRVLPAASAK